MGDMVSQFEISGNELTAAIKTFSALSRGDLDGTSGRNCWQTPVAPPEASREMQRARRTIIDNIAELQKLLWDPSDFLGQLARQNQLLACLQWLGEFQVLACIPLKGSVPFKDVAELAVVPEIQLSRVVRMTATSGFLQEPQPGRVAHTPLSSPFVSKPSFLDAAMFLSEMSAPAALQMPAATHRFGQSQQPNDSAYNLAFNTSITFEAACLQRPKLQRQWPAYLRHGLDDREGNVADILTRLDWLSLGNAKVVEVSRHSLMKGYSQAEASSFGGAQAGARSVNIASTLSELYPDLHFIVQMGGPPHATGGNLAANSMVDGTGLFPNPNTIFSSPSTPDASGRSEPTNPPSHRITVQQRTVGSPQSVPDAAVYIIQLPSTSPGMTVEASLAQTTAELRAHMGVLRANNFATLVLTARLLPEPGSVDPTVEATARVRDLSLVQLANGREIEAAEIENLLDSVRDSAGRLVPVNKLRSRNNATVAFEIRYQASSDLADL